MHQPAGAPPRDRPIPPDPPGSPGGGSGPSPAIAARGLTKRFGDATVVRSLDLDVPAGAILGLIGPSGCGKTTTVRLLAGLLTPTQGDAWICGRRSAALRHADRERIGYLPQAPALFPDLSLMENLSFHASMYGLPFRRRRRLDALLDWVELGPHRSKRVADVSGGMRRRLALAAAFVHRPDVVFLDEPTAGIDPILRDTMWAQFRETASEGATLVVTTQYVGEAGKCDVVGLLSDGELVLLGPPEQLRRAAFGGDVVDLTVARPIGHDGVSALLAHGLVVGGVEHLSPLTVRVVVDDAKVAAAELPAVCGGLGIEVLDVVEHVVDDDEAFVRIVERHRAAGRAREVAHAAT